MRSLWIQHLEKRLLLKFPLLCITSCFIKIWNTSVKRLGYVHAKYLDEKGTS